MNPQPNPGERPPWVAIVANPWSGSGPNHDRVQELVSALHHRHLEVETIWQPPEEAPVLNDVQALQSCRAIVAAGGDGTVSRVVNCRPRVPLGTLPLGTENLFAKELGFGLDIQQLVERIVVNRTRVLDLGVARGLCFSQMVTAGFDADVAHRFDRWRCTTAGLHRGSHARYILPILKSLCKYPYPRLSLQTGETTVSGTLAMVFNLPIYLGKLRVLPDARGDDGLLDWIVFKRRGAWPLARFAWQIRRGRHLRSPDVHYGQAKEIRLFGDPPVPVQLDGEAAGSTPLTVTIEAGALRILTG